jgi:hypothetical protein
MKVAEESLALKKYLIVLWGYSIGPYEGQPWPKNKIRVPPNGLEGYHFHT